MLFTKSTARNGQGCNSQMTCHAGIVFYILIAYTFYSYGRWIANNPHKRWCLCRSWNGLLQIGGADTRHEQKLFADMSKNIHPVPLLKWTFVNRRCRYKKYSKKVPQARWKMYFHVHFSPTRFALRKSRFCMEPLPSMAVLVRWGHFFAVRRSRYAVYL